MKVIKGGSVVTEERVFDADVQIDGGTISAIGPNLDGEVIVDATGSWVLPGAIDPHVHISLEGHSTTAPLLDDLVGATSAGLYGGVTTVGAYVQRTPIKDIVGVMKGLIAFGEQSAAADFFINALLLPGDDLESAIRGGAELGVMSFKSLLAYNKAGLMFDDEDLMRILHLVAEVGAVALIHAENGGAADYLDEVERSRGVSNASFLRTQPGLLEAEGMVRSAILAEIAKARVLFVHLSSKEGAETLRRLRSGPSGRFVACETQPHYLALTNKEVLDRGPLGKVGPPLKEADDVSAVWDAVISGDVTHISSDHSPKSMAVKLSADNILDATYGGIPGVEPMLPLVYELGFKNGRIRIEDVVRLTSSAAAREYGIYPRKGVIQEGSDADVVVIPKNASSRELTPANLHGPSDYSIYESLSSTGFPSNVVRRGTVVLRDGKLTGENPNGSYLRRTRTNPAFAS